MKTVIGLFDTSDSARRAMAHLVSAGIDEDHMDLRSGDDLATERARRTSERDTGIMARVRDFLGFEEPAADTDYRLSGVEPGESVLLVDTSDELADQAADIMNNDGAVDIDLRRSGATTVGYETTGGGYRATGSAEERTIPEVEEELQVGKRSVTRGRVRIYTVPTEHTAEEQVRLREESVRVEREPVDRPLRGDEVRPFEEQSIEVTESGEEPVVSKQARVKEEVHVSKDVEEHPEMVREAVRGTEVRTDREDQTRH